MYFSDVNIYSLFVRARKISDLAMDGKFHSELNREVQADCIFQKDMAGLVNDLPHQN